MNTRTDILEEIAWLAERDSLDPATSCRDLTGAWGLDDVRECAVEIVSSLELAYDIAISDDEAEEVWAQTVGDLVDLVKRKVER